jgi:CheY-like chemotaxis protein
MCSTELCTHGIDCQEQIASARGDLLARVRPVAPVILVVDNQPETRSFIARTLHLRGYEVIAVADGEAALAAAAVQFPDLVITDVLLPGMGGLSVIDTLRQQDPRLPVIAISAVPDVLEHPDVVPDGLDSGSIAFLAKPFALPALLDLVRQLLPQPLVG